MADQQKTESIGIKAVIAATFEQVDAFCGQVKMIMLERGEQKALFAVELLLREALNNAVIHGSKGDPDKTIACKFRIKARQAALLVQDQGAGFDFNNSPEIYQEKESHGRGLRIYRAYADKVLFNKKGNKVILFKNFV